MPGAVGGSARARHRLLAEMCRMPAERALINRTVGIAIERHAKVFQLVDDARRFAAHELDRVLVAKIVRSLHGIEHMPQPAVFGHIAERRADATLCGHGVRARRKHLREHGDIQPCVGKL
jgi:hypothetical protein